MLIGAWLRLAGIPSVEGTLQRDETRLALAARGVLERGVPLLPGGIVYTRGLLPAYTEALSFRLLGTGDLSAKLPSLIASVLLVPAVFFLARSVLHSLPALAAAGLVVFSPPLVNHGREAWLYSAFLLLFSLTLALFARGFEHKHPPTLLGAALCFVLSLFCHELAVLLLPPLGLLLLTRLLAAERAWLFCWPTLLTFGSMALGVAADLLLSLALRAPTLGGATSEMSAYLSVQPDLLGLRSYLGILAGWSAPLLVTSLLGLLFLRRTSRATRSGLFLCYGTLMTVLLFDAFVLRFRSESRYLAPALPPLFVTAVFGAVMSGRWVAERLQIVWRQAPNPRALGAFLALLLLLVSVDPLTLSRDASRRLVNSTWLQAADSIGPTDLIASFSPTVTTHYLGRTDFWIRPAGYERYVWAQPPLREIYTGALLVRNRRELEERVFQAHPGRLLWVVLNPEFYAGEQRGDRADLLAALRARAVLERETPDQRLVMKLQL